MTMFRKVLTASAVAIVLASVPSHLAAQDGPAATEVRASMLGWFTSIWGDLTAWLAGEVAPAPPQPEWLSQSQADNGCIVDPHGGCGG